MTDSSQSSQCEFHYFAWNELRKERSFIRTFPWLCFTLSEFHFISLQDNLFTVRLYLGRLFISRSTLLHQLCCENKSVEGWINIVKVNIRGNVDYGFPGRNKTDLLREESQRLCLHSLDHELS